MSVAYTIAKSPPDNHYPSHEGDRLPPLYPSFWSRTQKLGHAPNHELLGRPPLFYLLTFLLILLLIVCTASRPIVAILAPPFSLFSREYDPHLDENTHRRTIQSLLNNLQKTLDMIDTNPYSNPSELDIIRQALLKLSHTTGTLPSCMYTQVDMQNIDDHSLGGTFADIFSATYCGQRVALKRIRIFQTSSQEQKNRSYQALYREAMIWRQLNHPHILPLYGVDVKSFHDRPCIVLPWMANGTSRDALKSIQPNKLNAYLTQWVLEITQGVNYLHTQGITHGDLRGPNILIDEYFHVKLSDFGLASFSDQERLSILNSFTSNPRWAAPELLRYQDPIPCPDTRSDVYSFGCLCIELYTQQEPYNHIKGLFCVRDAVLRGERLNPPGDEVLPRKFWELAERSWVEEPHARPRMCDIMEELSHWLDEG